MSKEKLTDLLLNKKSKLPGTLQRIKEQAMRGTKKAYEKAHAPHTIGVLLGFSLSDESCFKQTAFWALKDYVHRHIEDLVDDLEGVICAFVNGAAEASDKVKAESATALAFLVCHSLVFTEAEATQRTESTRRGELEHEFSSDLGYVLDALMYLTGQEALDVRRGAFATLSSLATYAATSPHVMTQIQHDIKTPPG